MINNKFDPLYGLYGNIPGVEQIPGAEDYITGQQFKGAFNTLVPGLAKGYNPALLAGLTWMGYQGGGQDATKNLLDFQKTRTDLLKSGIDIKKGQYDLIKAPLDINNLQTQIKTNELELAKQQRAELALFNHLKNLPESEQLKAYADPGKWLDNYYQENAPSVDKKDYNFALAQYKRGEGPNPGSFLDFYKNYVKLKATNVSYGQETSYAREAGTKGYQFDEALVSKAFNMPDVAYDTNSASTIIASGKANLGAFAPLEQNFQTAKDKFFSTGEFSEKTNMTEVLEALLGKQVFPLIGELNIGARGLDTPAERKFLQKAFSGDITNQPDSLLKIQMMVRRRQERFASAFNKRLESGGLNQYQTYRGKVEKLVLPDAVPVARFKRNERTYTVYNNGEAKFDDDKSLVPNFDAFDPKVVLIGPGGQ